jgi:hypothetical protein
VLVLSVDVDQVGADLGQRGRRHGPTIDAGDAPAAAAQLAGQNELAHRLAVVQAQFGQRRLDRSRYRRVRVQLEDGLHEGAVGAGADRLHRRPAAQDGADGVDDDGLAGARLPREHVQAGPERDPHVFEQGKVADGEFLEHGRRPG